MKTTWTIDDELFDLAERAVAPYINRRTAELKAKLGPSGNKNRVIRDTIRRLVKALDGEDDLLMQLKSIVKATTLKNARLMGVTVTRDEENQRYLAKCLVLGLRIHQRREDDGGKTG